MHCFRFTYPLLTAIILSLAAPASFAQTSISTDTSQMTSNELYQYAEALRLGRGVEADIDQALELHSQLAQSGRAQSYERVALILLSQDRLIEAKAALEAGRDAGNNLARMRLAIAHVRGQFGSLSDPALGVRQLEEFTQSSDSAFARYVLAQAYQTGTGTSVQLERARAIYEDLAEDGHGQSLRQLGDFARDGTFAEPDLAAAADYYRAAAENGFDYAWLMLANLHLGEGRYAESIEAYQMAIASEISGAEAMFARRNFLEEFGPLSDRASAARILESKAENGDVDAAAEALILWERRSRRINTLDLEAVLAMLDEKMRAGDERATIALARAYRVLHWRIPQSRARHAEIVADFGDQLGRSRMRELFYSVYDPERHPQSRQATYEIVSTLEGAEFQSAARAIRATERTAFVFLLQKELEELGYFNGTANGVFNTRSLRATMRFCEDQGIADNCVHGPLTYTASMDIIRELADARE